MGYRLSSVMVLLCLVWILPVTADNTVSMYKCKTDMGAILFTDEPCSASELVEVMSEEQLRQLGLFATEETAQRLPLPPNSTTPPTRTTPTTVKPSTAPMPLTINEAIAQAAQYSLWIIVYLAALPVLAGLLNLFVRHKRPNAFLRACFSSLLYLSCLPGVFASLLTAYTLFFTHQNLLSVNWVIFLLPILAMGLTLIMVGRSVSSFNDLPAIGHLLGFITLTAIVFAVLLVLYKAHFFIGFFGSFMELLLLGGLLLLALKWAIAKLI